MQIQIQKITFLTLSIRQARSTLGSRSRRQTNAKSAKHQDCMMMILMGDDLDDDDLKIKRLPNRCHCRCEKYLLSFSWLYINENTMKLLPMSCKCCPRSEVKSPQIKGECPSQLHRLLPNMPKLNLHPACYIAATMECCQIQMAIPTSSPTVVGAEDTICI